MKIEPIRTATRTVKGLGIRDGKEVDVDLKITLETYNTPFNMSSIPLYSKFTIMDGPAEWGHGMFTDEVPEDKMEEKLNQIVSEIHLFKNK